MKYRGHLPSHWKDKIRHGIGCYQPNPYIHKLVNGVFLTTPEKYSHEDISCEIKEILKK